MFIGCIPLMPGQVEDLREGYPVVIDPYGMSPQATIEPIAVTYGDGCPSKEFRVDGVVDLDAPARLMWRLDFHREGRDPQQVGGSSMFADGDDPTVFGDVCLSLGPDEAISALCGAVSIPVADLPSEGDYLLQFSVTDGEFADFNDATKVEPETEHLDTHYWPITIDRETPCVTSD